MDRSWNDEQIKKALKGSVPQEPSQAVSGRVWASIERAVREGKAAGSSEPGAWNDEELRKALKGSVPQAPSQAVADRAWESIAGAIREGKRPAATPLWGLWGGAVRYAAAVLLILAGIGSALEYKDYRQKGKVAAYLEALAEGPEETDEDQPVRVSALLSEPLDGNAVEELLDEEEDEPGMEERGSLL